MIMKININLKKKITFPAKRRNCKSPKSRRRKCAPTHPTSRFYCSTVRPSDRCRSTYSECPLSGDPASGTLKIGITHSNL